MEKIRPKIRRFECYYAKDFYELLEMSVSDAVENQFRFFVPSKYYKLLSYEISGNRIRYITEKLQNKKSYFVK